MTLKERFQQWFINDVEEHYEGTVEEVAIEHERLAGDFAIGFAEWITRAELPLKELLEIYKKEKGL